MKYYFVSYDYPYLDVEEHPRGWFRKDQAYTRRKDAVKAARTLLKERIAELKAALKELK